MWNKRNGDILIRPGLNSPTSRKNSVIGDFAKLEANILELGIVVENRLHFSFLTDRAIPKVHSIRYNSKYNGKCRTCYSQFGAVVRRVAQQLKVQEYRIVATRRWLQNRRETRIGIFIPLRNIKFLTVHF